MTSKKESSLNQSLNDFRQKIKKPYVNHLQSILIALLQINNEEMYIQNNKSKRFYKVVDIKESDNNHLIMLIE